VKLSLISAGGVTPAGLGPDAIEAPWPVQATASSTGRPIAAGLIGPDHPGLAHWQKEPRLRRASPITYYMIEAVDQALRAAPETDRSRTGVIAAFFLGCLVYSVRFFRQITDEGRRFASPVLFPETVFNSPLSHVVATLGIGGPVYSQIGDKSCWATALRTAQCWLARDECDRVIVIGAEEFEPHEVDALQAGGLLRDGLQPCEGAVALLLGRSDGSLPSIHAVHDGYSFTSRKNAATAAARCLDHFPADLPLLNTATGWTRRLPTDRRPIGHQHPETEGFTVSAAADTLRAVHLARAGQPPDLIVPVWGLTRQVAAYRVTA